MICLVTSFHERDFSLSNHVKYDSYFLFFSERPFTNTPITLITVFNVSDRPMNDYMTISITILILQELQLIRSRRGGVSHTSHVNQVCYPSSFGSEEI